MLSFCIALSRFFRLPLTLASFSAVLALAACADDPAATSPLTPTESARTSISAPNILLTPSDTLRFGAVMIGRSAVREVQVTNNGSADLFFQDIQILSSSGEYTGAATTGPGCSYGGQWGLAPGQSCYIGISYSPYDVFPTDASLYLTHNAGQTFTILPLFGYGLPKAAIPVVDPQDIDFGPQLVGTTSATRRVEIVNKGEDDLVITGYSFAGIDPNDYALAQGGSSPCVLNQKIPPYSWCDVVVTFTPKATGTRSAALKVATNVGTTGADLTGIGYQPADVGVTLGAAAQQGKTVAYAITVKNAGPGLATGISLADVLPSGATFVALSAASDVSCSKPAVGGTGTVSCFVNSLASGDSRLVQLTLKPGNGAKSITNVVTVGTTSVDPIGSNNTASVTTQLAGKK